MSCPQALWTIIWQSRELTVYRQRRAYTVGIPLTASPILDVMEANSAPRAEFAYIDDSGDPGWKSGSTKTFGLGCVLVPVDHWTTRLDLLVEMRREVKRIYGLRMSDEVKGEWIVNIKKHFYDLGLGDGQLRDIYQRHMRVAPIVASGAVAVVMVKERVRKKDTDLEYWAWHYLLQRLRLRTLHTGAPIILMHDNGSANDRIRSHLRAYRRYDFVQGKQTAAPLLVEDSTPRDSQHSYFVQMADLAAYAATRCVMPPLGRRARICNEKMWNLLGTCRIEEASPRRDGIVVWPS